MPVISPNSASTLGFTWTNTFTFGEAYRFSIDLDDNNDPADGAQLATASTVTFTFYDSVGGWTTSTTLPFTVNTPVVDFTGAVITDLEVVPEPSTYALMGIGLVGLALLWRRRCNSA